MRLQRLWVRLVITIDLLQLLQAGLDLLQIAFSLEVIRQLKLKFGSCYSLLLLLLNSNGIHFGRLFYFVVLFGFGEVAEIRGVPVYFIHDVCAVADKLKIKVHQFLLVLLSHLLSMHQLGLFEVLLAHFLCIYMFGLELVVLLLRRDILVFALLPLLPTYRYGIPMGH